MTRRPRARAIVLQNGAIALIKRRREGHTYYVFPGGGVEDGETLEQAAIRETWEELGLHVQVERLVAEITFHGGLQSYFLTRITGGQFGTGSGPEMQGQYPPERGTFKPVWIPLTQLFKLNIIPPAIASLVAHAATQGWPEIATKLHER